MIRPGIPAGPPAPFHHSVTCPAAQEVSLQSVTVCPRCSPRLAGDRARVREADDLVELLARRPVQPQLDRQGVAVPPRRRQRIESRDRPRPCGEGQRALRQDGDEREDRERGEAERRREDDRHRAERDHQDAGGQRVAQHLHERAHRMPEPERAVDGRADGPVHKQQRGAEHHEPRDGGRRGVGDADALEEHAAEQRVPTVGGEVGEVTGADQAVVAEQRVDCDRREDHRERRQRTQQGHGDDGKRQRRVKRDPARQRDVVAVGDDGECEQHTEEHRLAPVRGRGQQQVGRYEGDDEQGVRKQPEPIPGRQAGQPFAITAISISGGESARGRKS